MSEPLRVVSLGAGVQSTTVMLLAEAGELGHVDAAIFADTGWEPRAVYEHLNRLEAATSIPIHRVSSADIRQAKHGQDAPFYLRNEDGSDGMLRRQCTSKLKIAPIRRKLRELMAEMGTHRVESLMGISLDEVQRMRDSDVKYVKLVYPLVERRMTRTSCLLWLAEHGWDAVPRSACIGCPLHSNAEWSKLSAQELVEVAAWEVSIQKQHASIGVRGVPFVHRDRVPILQVDLSTMKDRGQLDFDDECSGICGV